MSDNLYTENKIRTFTGKYIDVLNPQPEDIDIEDIAHALSNVCRFGGHLPKFFSVAQHCVNCSSNDRGDAQLGLELLLHDAAEAYIGDLGSPIKKRLPQYIEMEDRLLSVIAKKFGLRYPFVNEIKEVDKLMLVQEWDMLMIGSRSKRGYIVEHGSKKAKEKFMMKYRLYSDLIKSFNDIEKRIVQTKSE